MWAVGCFYGTGKELIDKAYKDSQLSGDCYKAVVKMAEDVFAVTKWNGACRPEPAGGLPPFDPSRLLAGRSSVTVEVRRLYGAEYEVELGGDVRDEASVKRRAISLAEGDNTFENPEHLLGTTATIV